MRRQVKLTPAADEYLRQLGEGQLSNGIERAAEQSRASNGLPSVAAHLRMLEERGVLQQRATQVFAGKRLSAVKVDGQPVSDMLIKERR